MAQLKQKTINVGNQSQTIALKRLENTMTRGGKWMYVIVDKDTGTRLEDPYTNKKRAKSAFKSTVSDIKRGMKSSASSSGPDMGLGGGSRGGNSDLDFGL